MQETAAVVQISVTSPDVWLARWAYHGISDMPPPRYLEPVKLSEEFFFTCSDLLAENTSRAAALTNASSRRRYFS